MQDQPNPHLRAPPFIPSEGDQSVLMHCDPSTDWPRPHPKRSSRLGRSERKTTRINWLRK
ncbi:unnamed protein product [Penicillium camemberti]|uniref:Str. FM013 n=1 Tax=Penicillium camemberti (strain FM 013) TaxID=1429867 RepID=A0A0G4PGK8_PENC3|nr:unnamed protein product [Penicillium camemberti]